jgi:short-subunit dehydrogenase
MKTPVVLITGISSGFGKEIAHLLVTRGYKVYGTSRREIECDSRINLLNIDVTDVLSVQKGVQMVLDAEGRIDVLVNNAGMGITGSLEDASEDEMHLQMNSNFFGMVHLVQAVLPSMRANRRGKIINISSLAGLMGLPYQGYYSASKYAIEGFSDSLRMELHEFGIQVILVNPGDFATHFTQNRRKVAHHSEDYLTQFQKTLSVIEKDETNGLKPVVLAQEIEAIIKASHPSSRYIVASAEQKLAVYLKKFLPSSWFYSILRSHYCIK